MSHSSWSPNLFSLLSNTESAANLLALLMISPPPKGWILAGGFGKKEERMNVCLWGNINQEVLFCAKPEYEPPNSSDEEL